MGVRGTTSGLLAPEPPKSRFPIAHYSTTLSPYGHPMSEKPMDRRAVFRCTTLPQSHHRFDFAENQPNQIRTGTHTTRSLSFSDLS